MADPSDIVAGLDALELEDDELVEAAILIVKTSRADGRSSLHHTATSGLSHWESLGILVDMSDGLREPGWIG